MTGIIVVLRIHTIRRAVKRSLQNMGLMFNCFPAWNSGLNVFVSMEKSKALFSRGLRESLDIIHFYNKKDYDYNYYIQCSSDEKKLVDGWVEEAKDYLSNTAKATDKEIETMLNELYQDGYYDYKLGENYEQSLYQRYNEGGK